MGRIPFSSLRWRIFSPILKASRATKFTASFGILAICIFLWQSTVDHNLMTSKATRLVATQDWSINDIPYQWISDSAVLYGIKGRRTGEPSYELKVRVYDVLTNRVQERDRFASSLDHMKVTSLEMNNQTGEILWSNGYEFIVTTHTGVFECHFKSALTGWYFWLVSERSICHFSGYSNTTDVIDIVGKHPRITRRLRFPTVLPSDIPLVQVIKSPLSSHIMLASWLPNPQLYFHEGIFEASIIYDDEVRSMATALRLGDKSEASIAEYSAKDTNALLSRWTITLPHHAVIQDRAISPDGRRILWQLRFSRPTFMSRFGRWFPAFHTQHNTSVAFWLSNVDGTELHEIAYQPEEIPLPTSVRVVKMGDGSPFIPSQEDQQLCQPSNIRWLPAGDKISFLFKDHLWLLSVQ